MAQKKGLTPPVIRAVIFSEKSLFSQY
jgi:hypothetical protein